MPDNAPWPRCDLRMRQSRRLFAAPPSCPGRRSWHCARTAQKAAVHHVSSRGWGCEADRCFRKRCCPFGWHIRKVGSTAKPKWVSVPKGIGLCLLHLPAEDRDWPKDEQQLCSRQMFRYPPLVPPDDRCRFPGSSGIYAVLKFIKAVSLSGSHGLLTLYCPVRPNSVEEFRSSTSMLGSQSKTTRRSPRMLFHMTRKSSSLWNFRTRTTSLWTSRSCRRSCSRAAALAVGSSSWI